MSNDSMADALGECLASFLDFWLLLAVWVRCRFGHDWEPYDAVGGPWRECRRCGRYEAVP